MPEAVEKRYIPTTEAIMNRDEAKGGWTKAKGKIREKWGELTDDDLDRIQGKYEQLVGALQQRYGWEKEQAQKEVAAWRRENQVTLE